MTFDATVNPVIYEGGIPVFIDIEKDIFSFLKDVKSNIETLKDKKNFF